MITKRVYEEAKELLILRITLTPTQLLVNSQCYSQIEIWRIPRGKAVESVVYPRPVSLLLVKGWSRSVGPPMQKIDVVILTPEKAGSLGV